MNLLLEEVRFELSSDASAKALRDLADCAIKEILYLPVPHYLRCCFVPADSNKHDYTLRVFNLKSSSGSFEATEVLNPGRSEHVTPYPILQSQLYSADQPGKANAHRSDYIVILITSGVQLTCDHTSPPPPPFFYRVK